MGEVERIETVVLGVYDPEHPRGHHHVVSRRKAIVSKCAAEILPSPDFDTPEHVQAITRGSELLSEGKRVLLVGGIDDLRLPAHAVNGAFGIAEWREAWLAYLTDEGLGFVTVGKPVQATIGETSRTSVIRAYQHSCQSLRQMIARIRSENRLRYRAEEPGFVYGRPPYGYVVRDGRLTKDPVRAPRVLRAFQFLRSGKTIPETARAMSEMASKVWLEGSKKCEFWDAKKIRRLLAHANLYCLGEYRPPIGDPVRLPSLAILPKDWLSVVESKSTTSTTSARTSKEFS